MAGLKGMSRLPRSTIRARRNAAALATKFGAVSGEGLYVSPEGKLSIHLKTAGYLDQDSGGLYVDTSELDAIFVPYTGAEDSLDIGTHDFAGQRLNLTATDSQLKFNGQVAMQWDGIATGNILAGRSAGNALEGGLENTIFGCFAGQALTTGSYNIIIGSGADVDAAARATVILIGYGSVPTADNQCLIGSHLANGKITNIFLGQGVTKASPDDMTIQATGGQGTDNPAGDFIVAGGRSTGNASPGAIVLKVSEPGASGSAAQALIARATIDNSTADFSGLNITTTGAIQISASDRIDSSGFFRPISSADAAAPNNSIYYSTDASKLVYKDGTGTPRSLY